MLWRALSLALAALLAVFPPIVFPAESKIETPPFSAASIGTLGGNCQTNGALPFQSGAVTQCGVPYYVATMVQTPASASGNTYTGSITSPLNQIVIPGSTDFRANEGVLVPRGGGSVAGTPVVTASLVGAAGGSRYDYEVECIDSTGGGHTAASSASTVAAGPVSFTTQNYISLALSGCATGYAVYRQTGGAGSFTFMTTVQQSYQVTAATIATGGTGCPNASTLVSLSEPTASYSVAARLTVTISGGVVTAVGAVAAGGTYQTAPAVMTGDVTGANCATNPTFNATSTALANTYADTGFTYSGPFWLSNAITAGAVRDWCLGTVSSVAYDGVNTTITLGSNCANNTSGNQTIRHEESAAINALIQAGATNGAYIFLPCGTYALAATLVWANVGNTTLHGSGSCTLFENVGTQDQFAVQGRVHAQVSGDGIYDIWNSGNLLPALGKTIFMNWGTQFEFDRMRFTSPFDGVYSFNSDGVVSHDARILYPSSQSFDCLRVVADAAESNHGIWHVEDFKCFGNNGGSNSDLFTAANGIHIQGNIATFNCFNCQVSRVEGNSWNIENNIGATTAPYYVNCFQCTGEYSVGNNLRLADGAYKMHFVKPNFFGAGFGPNYVSCSASANVSVGASTNDSLMEGGNISDASGEGVYVAGNMTFVGVHIYSNSNSGANQGGTVGQCDPFEIASGAAGTSFTGGMYGSADHPTWQASCGIIDAGATGFTVADNVCNGAKTNFNHIINNAGRAAGSVRCNAGDINDCYPVLATVAVPMVNAPSGNITNTGSNTTASITLGTALDLTYPKVLLELPANAIFSGSAAGWYYGSMSSTTAGVVCNNIYSTGSTAYPNACATFATVTAAAYTGLTGSNTAFDYLMPANQFGPTDGAQVQYNGVYTNSGNSKVYTVTFGGTTIESATLTTTHSMATLTGVRNVGVTNSQMEIANSNALGAFVSNAGNLSQSSIDTTAAVHLKILMNKATATEYQILMGATVTFLPGLN